jgi:hypothetical protein
MARWLFVLLVVFLALVSIASPSPAQVQELPHHAYFPLASKNYPTPAPPKYIMDILVYPEQPQIWYDMFVVAFGHASYCSSLLDYSLTTTNRHILITAEVGRQEGRICFPEEPARDWAILERIYLGRDLTDGSFPEPGEWVAEIRVTFWNAWRTSSATETMSVTFNMLPAPDNPTPNPGLPPSTLTPPFDP